MLVYWLSIIGSVCSIIGIPFTIVQVFKIKSNSEAAKHAIDNFLILNKNGILIKIQDTLSEQINVLKDIKKCIRNNNKGYDEDYISNQCNQIIDNINICILNIPVEYEDIGLKLQNIINIVEELEDTKNISKISEIRNFLFMIINLIKEEKEKYINLQKNNSSS